VPSEIYDFTPCVHVQSNISDVSRPHERRVQTGSRPGAHKSLAAHEPQSSKMRRGIMHKDFIVML